MFSPKGAAARHFLVQIENKMFKAELQSKIFIMYTCLGKTSNAES